MLNWRSMYSGVLVLAGAVTAALIAGATLPVQAGWLSNLAREVGDVAQHASGKALRHGAGSFDNAAAYISKLAPPNKTGVLAVEITQEGHLRFANKAGEKITAGTPDELQRAMKLLLPDGAALSSSGRGVSLYLTPDSIFLQRALLEKLPRHAKLNVVIGDKSYPLVVSSRGGASARVHARLPGGLLLEMKSAAVFNEALWQMRRALNRASIRLLSFQPGARRFVPTAPSRDMATRALKPDIVDPHAFLTSMSTIRGQSVLVQGHIKGAYLHFLPGSGSEGAVKLSRLRSQAAAHDINLIMLNTRSATQPGARNWLWQRMGVPGLEKALQQKTYGGFLGELAADAKMALVVTQLKSGQVTLSMRPLARGGQLPGSDTITDAISDVVSNITGNLVQNGMQLSLRSSERQKELDRRIIPRIPSTIQFIYIGLLVMGLMALDTARGWWRRLWPREERSEYATRFGFLAARTVRVAVFGAIFLPISAPFALPVHLARQLWHILKMPLRFWRWITGSNAASV